MTRRLHFGAFMRPISIHTGAWRYPGAWPDANFNLARITRLIRTLEAAKFDAFATSFEPFTLLSALAMVTQRIGLVATASTTYDEPYHVARRFASLDHISAGRAGWNIVTTGNPETSHNFGSDLHLEHASRYARAREFHDVVTGLWDSWADDAFVRDVDSGVFFDPGKLHVLNHKAAHLSVRGPLNIARPVQGWPVIVQAGVSEAGRQLAAETAEVIFGAASSLADGKAFYADVKGRMPALGRDPDALKILPAAFVVVGDTVDEAKARRAHLDSLVHYDSGIRSLSIALDYDVSGFDPDGPLPDVPESNASKSGRDRTVAYARANGATIRTLAAKAGS
ncbi:NtaA/DmoA family FMN-dependent monooxygenase [uncultured Sphingomonas sp.]|uniref:NtaA/DmoA family FMN-dependent monooxygenase n=1 Tax=uncultured Sphingomonas sp. TaxID=158754 RepID=UPI0035CAF6CD